MSYILEQQCVEYEKIYNQSPEYVNWEYKN